MKTGGFATVATIGGAALVAAAQVSPETAKTNLAGWAEMFGLTRLSRMAEGHTVDLAFTVVGLAIFSIGIGLLFWPKSKEKRAENPRTSLPPNAAVWFGPDAHDGEVADCEFENTPAAVVSHAERTKVRNVRHNAKRKT